MPIRGLVLLVFFVGSLPVCFVRPFYGLLLWTIIAFLNPQSALFYWDIALAIPWALAVAIPTIAGCMIFNPSWISRLPSRHTALLLMLWLWFTISSVISSHTDAFVHHSADTWTKWELVSKILLMTFITIGLVDNYHRLRILLLTVGTCFAVYALKALPFVVLTGGAFKLYGPENSMVADNNDFGLAMNMTLPIYFFFAQTEQRGWVKMLCRISCLAAIPSVMFTYSRGALVGLAAVLLAMLLTIRQRVAVAAGLAVVALFAWMIAPPAWRDRMDPTKDHAIDESAWARLHAWEVSWRLACDYPVAGGGFGTFTPRVYSQYAEIPAGSGLGAHSIYFQVLGEHGFVGLGLFLTLIVSSLWTSTRLVWQGRAEGDRRLIAYANLLRFSLVGFLTSGAFLGRAYFDYFFLIVACIAVLDRLAAETPLPDEEGEPGEDDDTLALGDASVMEAR